MVRQLIVFRTETRLFLQLLAAIWVFALDHGWLTLDPVIADFLSNIFEAYVRKLD